MDTRYLEPEQRISQLEREVMQLKKDLEYALRAIRSLETGTYSNQSI